jgi:hypothetical protein
MLGETKDDAESIRIPEFESKLCHDKTTVKRRKKNWHSISLSRLAAGNNHVHITATFTAMPEPHNGGSHDQD